MHLSAAAGSVGGSAAIVLSGVRKDNRLVRQYSVAQLLPAQRRRVVVYFFKCDAALPEQLVQLATLGSSRFFVNCNLIFSWHVVSGQLSVVSCS